MVSIPIPIDVEESADVAEIANNGYRDGFSGLNNTEDSFLNDGPGVSADQRRMNAVRAYFEWMPLRLVYSSGRVSKR